MSFSANIGNLPLRLQWKISLPYLLAIERCQHALSLFAWCTLAMYNIHLCIFHNMLFYCLPYSTPYCPSENGLFFFLWWNKALSRMSCFGSEGPYLFLIFHLFLYIKWIENTIHWIVNAKLHYELVSFKMQRLLFLEDNWIKCHMLLRFCCYFAAVILLLIVASVPFTSDSLLVDVQCMFLLDIQIITLTANIGRLKHHSYWWIIVKLDHTSSLWESLEALSLTKCTRWRLSLYCINQRSIQHTCPKNTIGKW